MMNGGPVGFILFGLGASLSTMVMRRIGEGSPLDLRKPLKDAVRAWLTIVDAAADAQTEYDAFEAELRAEAEPTPGATTARRRITIEGSGT